MKLKIGDLVAMRRAHGPLWRIGTVFQTDERTVPRLVNIHFGTFTFWLLEEEHELNNLKLLSEK